MRPRSIPFRMSVRMVCGATLLLFGCTSPTEPTWFAPGLALERALDDWNPNGQDDANVQPMPPGVAKK